jgi:hypothetical protein
MRTKSFPHLTWVVQSMTPRRRGTIQISRGDEMLLHSNQILLGVRGSWPLNRMIHRRRNKTPAKLKRNKLRNSKNIPYLRVSLRGSNSIEIEKLQKVYYDFYCIDEERSSLEFSS